MICFQKTLIQMLKRIEKDYQIYKGDGISYQKKKKDNKTRKVSLFSLAN